MTSSRFHVPGGVMSAPHSARMAPPAASMRRSFPSEMKAIERLSGDQNGAVAFVVPARGCGTVLSSERTQSIVVPAASGATNANRRPSGEIARRNAGRSEEHTSELQSPDHLVCRLLLEKKKEDHRQACCCTCLT